jgi:hypothetical protein
MQAFWHPVSWSPTTVEIGKNVGEFRHLGKTLRNQRCIYEEIKNRLD